MTSAWVLVVEEVVFTRESEGNPLNTQHAQNRPVQATGR